MLARSLRQPNGHFISLQEHIEPGPLECAPRDKRNYMTSSGCRTRTWAQSSRPFRPPWLYKLGKNRNLCAVAFIETNAGQPDGALSALALSEHFKSICLFIKSRYWAGIPLPGANASELAGISHLSSSARYGQFLATEFEFGFCFLTACCAARFVSACVRVFGRVLVAGGRDCCCALSSQVLFEVQRWDMSSCAASPANYC